MRFALLLVISIPFRALSAEAPALIPYMEQKVEREDEIIAQLIQRFHAVVDKKYREASADQNAETGHENLMLRGPHPKAMGCVVANFSVMSANDLRGQLPAEFFTGGLLQTYAGKQLDAVIRFSSSSSAAKADFEADARGLALKILGVAGEKWELPPPVSTGSSRDNQFAMNSYSDAQDFVMFDHPVFPIHDVAAINDLTAVAAEEEGALKNFLFPTVNPLGWRFIQLAQLKRITKKSPANPLTKQFFSATPYAWFGYPTKFTVVSDLDLEPVSTDTGDHNLLRTVMHKTLAEKEVTFDFKIQIRKKDEENLTEVIENGATMWNDKDYPFIKIATITIPKQTVNNQKKLADCDNLSFNIWNGFKVYQPVGSLNRARRPVYKDLSDYRHKVNKVSQ